MRAGLAIVGVLFTAWLVLNFGVALLAVQPSLQASIFGAAEPARRSPSDLGLSFETVSYGSNRDAWWVPAKDSRGTVVLVHGYDTFSDPKSGDAGPLLEMAAAFQGWGYDSLIINLGYGTGAHPYSGGQLEADDVSAAARWCSDKSGKPVWLWGFSAGGAAVLLAAATGAPVSGVVTDSAFADAGEVIVEQAERMTHLPAATFALVPSLMTLLAWPGPVNLETELAKQPIEVPVLLIHGEEDRTIDLSNLRILQRVTGANDWVVPGADHIQGYKVETTGYVNRARAFLESNMQTLQVPGRVSGRP